MVTYFTVKILKPVVSRRRVFRCLPSPAGSVAGFSTIEILVALGVIAVIAAIGIQMFSSASKGLQSSKLESDTATLNRAVTMYLASGGDLSTTRDPSQVLAKLKTISSPDRIKTQINPITGSLIDHRLVAEMQSESEAMSDQPRAYWNAGDKAFEIVTVGNSPGVKRFTFDEKAVAGEIQVDSRKSGSMQFASESGWIWDHGNRTPDSGLEPTRVPLVAGTYSPVPATAALIPASSTSAVPPAVLPPHVASLLPP